MSIIATLAPTLMPRHIAIIMDGNNRYGKSHQLGRGEGHIAGKDALDPIVEYCVKTNLEVLTVFAFSSENWQRPASEVALLMRLLALTINEQMPRMRQYRIRLRFIGDRTQLSDELQELMHYAEAETATFDAMTLVIAISYGGQWDIAHAAQQLLQQVQAGHLKIEEVNKERLAEYVELADAPEVDMLIRTGGEYRLSNFLLWQSAYAELFFTQTLWPDFHPDELNSMIIEFAKRQRRFGKTSEQVVSDTSPSSI